MESDDETGFRYHINRHYAPWLARWTKTDPLLTTDGLNLYSYVLNAPTRLVDPTGTAGTQCEIHSSYSEVASRETWSGDNIIIQRDAYGFLQSSLPPEDRKYIRLKDAPTFIKAHAGGRTEKVGIPTEYKVLQVDTSHISDDFLWNLAKSVATSPYRAIVGTQPENDEMAVEKHYPAAGGKERTLPDPWPISNAGQTFVSKDIQTLVYGRLVPRGDKDSTTSRFDDLTLVYINSHYQLQEATVAHEVLAHLFLATQKMPSDHSKSLKGFGLKGPSGKEFEGTVWDFAMLVEKEASQNLNRK
jgi:RHS repeat-associated protein